MRPPWLPRVYDNRFWRFLTEPEEDVSLKLFFDNFRNSTIAATLIFAGFTLRAGDSSKWRYGFGVLLLLVGFVLTALSALQLFALSLRALHSFRDLGPPEFGMRTKVARVATAVLILLTIALSVSVVWFVLAALEQMGNRARR